jgi:hypothetical protein
MINRGIALAREDETLVVTAQPDDVARWADVLGVLEHSGYRVERGVAARFFAEGVFGSGVAVTLVTACGCRRVIARPEPLGPTIRVPIALETAIAGNVFCDAGQPLRFGVRDFVHIGVEYDQRLRTHSLVYRERLDVRMFERDRLEEP